MNATFATVYRRSIEEKEKFWAEAAESVHWFKRPDTILSCTEEPFYRWFAGGETNACYNAVDVHIDNGHGDQIAIIHDSPVIGKTTHYTYLELRDAVAKLAGALNNMGVGKGDRVIIYMPMVAEAAISMLACARIGAIHSVVFGGFASNELAVRIDDCEPKVILSASCGIEVNRLIAYKPLLDAAIAIANHKPDHCLILQREQCTASLIEGRDWDWQDAIARATAQDCVSLDANHPQYILYTSGTTGQPKGVVRDTGGHIVALKWTMKNIYDADPGDVYWAASDVGWIVGHSYIVYAPLFNRNTTVIYEGKPVGTPDPGAFWRLIAEHRVKILFTAPTALRAIKKEDPKGEYLGKYDISCLQSLFLAGERTDPDTLEWAESKVRVPVIDHWWQTETAWSICTNCMGIEPQPIVHGSPTLPAPGYDVSVLDKSGRPVEADKIGTLVVKLPLPPGTFTNLWNAQSRYIASYFKNYPGFYETGDAGYINDKGYVFVMSRTDDVINVAGHRLSTGAMEEVLAAHPDVAECAVMGAADTLKGQLPVGLLVLSAGVARDHQAIIDEVIQNVRDKIGPVAAFKSAVVVNQLPKTRSGKILRSTMRKIADGEDYKIPATIDNPAILDEIREALTSIGYADSTS